MNNLCYLRRGYCTIKKRRVLRLFIHIILYDIKIKPELMEIVYLFNFARTLKLEIMINIFLIKPLAPTLSMR